MAQVRQKLTGSVSVLAEAAAASTDENGATITRPYADVGWIIASNSAGTGTFRLQDDDGSGSDWTDVAGVEFDVAAGETGLLAFDAGACREDIRVVANPSAISNVAAFVVFTDKQESY